MSQPDPAILSSLTVLRKPGVVELDRIVKHNIGYHFNVIFTGTYNRPLPRRILYPALRALVVRHPALGVHVVGEETADPYFVRLKSVNLNKIVRYEDAEIDLNEFLGQEHSTPFPIAIEGQPQPLWRIVVLERTGQIAFIYHHVIADGTSGLSFHRSLLAALNKASLEEQPNSIADVPQDKAFFPSMEDHLHLTLSWKSYIHHQFPSLAPKPNPPPPGLWTGRPHMFENNVCRTFARAVQVPWETLFAIRENCRKENVTLQPFLQIIVGQAIAEAVPEAGALQCAAAISLRRYLKDVGPDDLGVWISAWSEIYTRQELIEGEGETATPWDLVRRAKTLVDREINRGTKDVLLAFMKFDPDIRASLLAKPGKPRANTYSVTNVGLFDGGAQDERDGFKGEDMVFSQSSHVQGSALQYQVVGTKGGSLSLCVTWQEGVVDVDVVERINEKLRARLLRAGQYGKSESRL